MRLGFLIAAALLLSSCDNRTAAQRLADEKAYMQDVARMEATERQEYLSSLSPTELAAEEERLAWEDWTTWADPYTKCEYIVHYNYYGRSMTPRMAMSDNKYVHVGCVNV